MILVCAMAAAAARGPMDALDALNLVARPRGASAGKTSGVARGGRWASVGPKMPD